MIFIVMCNAGKRTMHEALVIRFNAFRQKPEFFRKVVQGIKIRVRLINVPQPSQ